MSSSQTKVLITGFTGFVAKVVVEELCRQQHRGELPPLEVVLLIRAAKGKSAQERFDRLLDSICFKNMHEDWHKVVTVIEADLERPDLGLTTQVYSELSWGTTNIIHCAASTDFDNPLEQAVRHNIDTALNILSFAKSCPQLRRMVATSTAYVHTETTRPTYQRLAPLPAGWEAEALYEALTQKRVVEKSIIKLSGHPNTYTFTKCLSEHLLVKCRESVPLSIVRPSIVNVALKYPFAGYTDSYSSLGGMGALIGSGFLHVMVGDRATLFDLVPVDLVAQHLIDVAEIRSTSSSSASFSSSIQSYASDEKSPNVPITHCVAGVGRSACFEQIKSIGIGYFSVNRERRRAFWRYTGPRDFEYQYHLATTQTIPMALICYWLAITGQKKQYQLLRLLKRGVEKCNKVFPYFLSNTFDFVHSQPFPEDFAVEAYLWLTAQGIHKHLIKRELWQDRSLRELGGRAEGENGGGP